MPRPSAVRRRWPGTTRNCCTGATASRCSPVAHSTTSPGTTPCPQGRRLSTASPCGALRRPFRAAAPSPRCTAACSPTTRATADCRPGARPWPRNSSACRGPGVPACSTTSPRMRTTMPQSSPAPTSIPRAISPWTSCRAPSAFWCPPCTTSHRPTCRPTPSARRTAPACSGSLRPSAASARACGGSRPATSSAWPWTRPPRQQRRGRRHTSSTAAASTPARGYPTCSPRSPGCASSTWWSWC